VEKIRIGATSILLDRHGSAGPSIVSAAPERLQFGG
jgi:hypothetical protein